MLDKPRHGYYTLPQKTKTILEIICEQPDVFLEQSNDIAADMIGIGINCTIFRHWKRYGFRQVYPDLDTSELCLGTDVLENLKYEEIEGIFPTFCINVPRNFPLEFEGKKLIFALVDCDKAMIIPKGSLVSMIEELTEYTQYIKMTFIFEDGLPRVLLIPFSNLNPDGATELRDHAKNEKYITYSKYIAAWVFNLMLLMRNYPSYSKDEKSSLRIINKTYHSTETKVTLHKELKLENIVKEHIRKSYNQTGYHVSPHIRKGHWRRQPHGANFDTTGFKVGYFDDLNLRPYHLILIKAQLIGAKNEKDS